MDSKRYFLAFTTIFYLASIFAVNWQEDRTEFIFISVFYSLSFISYIGLLKFIRVFKFKHLLIIALLAQAFSIWNEPNLSIDYYRFIWDGEITLAGINPFDFTPKEIYEQELLGPDKYMMQVYEGIGWMSQQNYSCYPPANQLYFILASGISNNLWINTVGLKLLILITQCIGFIYLLKTLKLLNIDKNRAWMLYLNPLWIIECTGNTHFEGVMISFLFVAFYFLLQKKESVGALFFAIAVQIKLIPLMILPFFYRYLGFWKSVIFYITTIAIVIGLGLIQLDASNIEHFMNSLRLYFQVFEFNSFILHYYVQFGIAETGWNMTKTYGPQLSRIAIAIIMTLALYGQISNWKKLFQRITIGFFFYLLLSSTLHPWYILPMLAFSLFTNYSFTVLWSFLIFFSYVFYSYENSTESVVRIITNIEYVLLISLFVFEMVKKRSPLNFLRVDYYQQET